VRQQVISPQGNIIASTPEEYVEPENERESDVETQVQAEALSSDDVLSPYIPRETQEDTQEDDSTEESDQEIETSTWSINQSEQQSASGALDDEETQNTELNSEEEVSSTVSLCNSPLVGPIWFGRVNDQQEVRKLEQFFVSQWESISVDGKYTSVDVEVAKKFQLQYKQDVLDPWGITEPTWYIWSTSVKKINELGCQ